MCRNSKLGCHFQADLQRQHAPCPHLTARAGLGRGYTQQLLLARKAARRLKPSRSMCWRPAPKSGVLQRACGLWTSLDIMGRSDKGSGRDQRHRRSGFSSAPAPPALQEAPDARRAEVSVSQGEPKRFHNARMHCGGAKAPVRAASGSMSNFPNT